MLLRRQIRYVRRRWPVVSAARERIGGQFNIPIAVLSRRPAITFSGLVPDAPLGLASLMPWNIRFPRAWFLLSPYWTIEREYIAEEIRTLATYHRLINPGHKLVFLCSTPEEAALLRDVGEAAIFCNMASNSYEAIFCPLDGVGVDFDAIYNAQLAPWKRHELTLGIERCGFLYYRDSFGNSTLDSERALFERHAAQAPEHVFINSYALDGTPIEIGADQVNRHLNRAAVGLCLSEAEGAMFASVEYMLAGLPVVSTPSTGGRHVFFDDDYCLTADPDPRSINEAVQALKARKIPRAHIREKTLARLQPHRDRLVDLVNRILDERGAPGAVDAGQLIWRHRLMTWQPAQKAVSQLSAGLLDLRPDQ